MHWRLSKKLKYIRPAKRAKNLAKSWKLKPCSALKVKIYGGSHQRVPLASWVSLPLLVELVPLTSCIVQFSVEFVAFKVELLKTSTISETDACPTIT